MPRLSANTRQELHEVLQHFDINAADLHDIQSGRVNKHWRVESGGARYALRRYNPLRSPDAIYYEHAVLRHMTRKGWPVAVPLQADEPTSFVLEQGNRYALFPFLPGRPGPRNGPGYLRMRGALLAHLHRDLSSFTTDQQRDGFDRHVPTSDGRKFDAILDVFAREQPRLAELVRSYRQTNLDELARLEYESLPNAVGHGDFHAGNILFHRRRLTAVLDFDSVHRDVRAVDIALAIALDCAESPAHTSLDLESVRAFVGAYHDESALREQERVLMVPLIRAYYLWRCWFSLMDWLDGDVEKATRSLGRTLDHQLPNLEARTEAIRGSLLGC